MKKRSIFFKISFLTWVLIIITLAIFVFSTIPYQKEIILQRMKSEAKDIVSSISQVTATAIIAEDYNFTLEHCLNIVHESNSIMYAIITKKNGFSLIIEKNGWKVDTLKNNWISGNENISEIKYDKIVGEEVFYFKYPFSYSGINWGWINISLSLKKYNADISELYIRTFSSTLISILVGFFASILFARRISRPIHHLNEITHKVIDGDLNSRAIIYSGDEIEELSNSFNTMTKSLQEAQNTLEKQVEQRTEELAKTNEVLEKEILEKEKGKDLLQTSLNEKEILLKEIHHRVKNNLQIISSLLYLQSRKVTDRDLKNILQDSQTRVKSMSLVHEKLYQSKTLSHIQFKEYVDNLTSYIFNYYSHSKNVRLKVNIKDIKLNIDVAVPCGLIINEIVSNSMKYAFPDDFEVEKPIIDISVEKEEDSNYTLKIFDNGIGLPKDFNIHTSKSLGLKLVNSLIAQIEGTVNINSENGTEYLITFIDRNKVRTKTNGTS